MAVAEAKTTTNQGYWTTYYQKQNSARIGATSYTLWREEWRTWKEISNVKLYPRKILNSYFIQCLEEDLKLKVIRKQNEIDHENITALEEFVKEIIDRNDPIPNRKVNRLRMRQMDEEKLSDFFQRGGTELDRAKMETMSSSELHSLITIMGLKDSIQYKDLTKPRDPGEKDLITNRELLSNMYQLEKTWESP